MSRSAEFKEAARLAAMSEYELFDLECSKFDYPKNPTGPDDTCFQMGVDVFRLG